MKMQRQHLKPQDVVLLLKMVSDNNPSWNQKPMAESLGLSQSEVSEAVARCKFSGLLAPDGKTVMRTAFIEFLHFGLRYVFPQQPGAIVRGIPTSHSAAPLNAVIQSNEMYVWPYGKGTVRGHSIIPLYPTVPVAALNDIKLHELLALTDALRVGRAREKEIALVELKKRFDLGK